MFKIKTNTRELSIRDDNEEMYFDMCLQALIRKETPLEKHSSLEQVEEATAYFLEKLQEEAKKITEQSYEDDAGDQEETDTEEASYPPPSRPVTSVDDDDQEVDMEKGKTFKGFVHIECEHCGEIISTCLKHGQRYFECKKCGQPTKMTTDNMRKVDLRCQCGNVSYYHTNRIDGMFEIDCINCGTPVAVEWNRKKKGYVTIGE